MRIDPTALPPVLESPTRESESTPARAPASPPAVVSIGDAASAAGTGRIPAAVDARIARVRELLASGKLEVDLDRLAERILDDDLARTGTPT